MRTCVILNDDKEIKYILQDEFRLFPEGKPFLLDEIVSYRHIGILNHFFNTLSQDKRMMNWQVDILIENCLRKVYFSGISWIDHFLVCISEDEINYAFLSTTDEHNELIIFQDKETSIDELKEISRLNNELVGIQRELTKKNLNLELLNEKLEELATTDPLTGIFNRRAVLERVMVELNRALREGKACGLAILDLDQFKKINDQFGHLMGDDALKITSLCLRESTREYDVAGRIGGDEFLVFFSVKSKQQFEKILNRLLSEINKHKMDISGELTIQIKASVGGVFVGSEKSIDEVNINSLMKKADDALYYAKDAGGNTVRIQEL